MGLRLFFIVILFVLFGAFSARSEEFDISHQPSASPSGSFPSVETTELFSEGRWGFRYSFDFENDPLILTDSSGNPLLHVIDERYVSEFGGAYGFSWFEIGGSLPLIVQNSIGRPIVGVTKFTDYGIGDLRIFIRRRLLESASTGFSFGTSLNVTAPTSMVTFSGSSWPTVQPNLVLDWQSQYVRAAANVGVRVQKSSTFANLETGTGLTYGAGLLVRAPWLKPVSLLGEFSGETSKFDFDQRHTPLEARGGFRIDLGDAFELSAGYGKALTSGYGSPNQNAFFTVTYRSKPKREGPLYWTPPGIQIIGNQIVSDAEIRFVTESDELESGATAVLDSIAQTIRRNAGIGHVYVEVYAEAEESAASSLHLASRRAQVLLRNLVEHAIPTETVSAEGLLPYKSSAAETTDKTKSPAAIVRNIQFRFDPKKTEDR